MARTVAKGLIALLMLASASLAQAQSPESDDLLASTPKARVVYESLVGYGGVGFRGGVPRFTGDTDVTKSISPRLSGDLTFSYVWDDHLVADLDIGYGWNRLGSDPQRWLITSVPMTLGARYLMNHQGRNHPFIGAGGGLYIWSILTEDQSAAKDQTTFERLRRGDFGVYVTGGAERRMSKWVTASADITYHSIFAADKASFPDGYNGNKSYLQARLGVNFFFSLSERLDQGLPE